MEQATSTGGSDSVGHLELLTLTYWRLGVLFNGQRTRWKSKASQVWFGFGIACLGQGTKGSLPCLQLSPKATR